MGEAVVQVEALSSSTWECLDNRLESAIFCLELVASVVLLATAMAMMHQRPTQSLRVGLLLQAAHQLLILVIFRVWVEQAVVVRQHQATVWLRHCGSNSCWHISRCCRLGTRIQTLLIYIAWQCNLVVMVEQTSTWLRRIFQHYRERLRLVAMAEVLMGLFLGHRILHYCSAAEMETRGLPCLQQPGVRLLGVRPLCQERQAAMGLDCTVESWKVRTRHLTAMVF
mmetsp:Transcript_32587/g.74953  ORF Transcript_32587/g.74953 Transcript_32587/m.74953 type:complete len:225 (+) Transcript_32587:100-774(+)